MPRFIFAAIAALLIAPTLAQAQSSEPMTQGRVLDILLALDPDAAPSGPGIELTIEDVPLLVIVDPRSDRLRAMVPIRSTDDMSDDDLRRVLQANFDTALAARYAVAQGRLWGTFLHPLSPLQRDELISELGQTVNLALTYGTLFTSGALSFGGGDSPDLQRDLINRLLEKGQDI
ncbi:MAG: hypothetical protein GKR98_01130 [Boseongicola sp.]|nr:MAG: hypothetical protein GKR98_01130 [Boseongicola sp.]